MSVWERQIGLSDCAVYNIHLWDCVCDCLNIKYVRYCTVASNIQICVYVAAKVSNTSKSNAMLWHSQFLAQIMQASYCRLWVVTCSAAAWKTEGVYFVPAATPKVFFGWGKMACCLITAQALKHWKPRPLLISPKMVYYWLVWLKKKMLPWLTRQALSSENHSSLNNETYWFANDCSIIPSSTNIFCP